MKTEKFVMCDKNNLFANSNAMHDCTFSLCFTDNTLSLSFDNLQQYCDNTSLRYGDYKKLTIRFYNVKLLDLNLKFGKKEKNYVNTVAPLDGCELIMFKYSIDCFNSMTLYFHATIKKKLWNCNIEITPKEIEYMWE